MTTEQAYNLVNNYLLNGDYDEQLLDAIQYLSNLEEFDNILIDSLEEHFNKQKLYFIDFIRSFMDTYDRYYSRYDMDINDSNKDLKNVMNSYFLPSKYFKNVNIEYKLFSTLIPKVMNIEPCSTLLDIFKFYIKRLSVYEIANGYVEKTDNYFKNIHISVNTAARESISYIDNYVHSYNNRMFAAMNKGYKNVPDEKIKYCFEDYYNDPSKYYDNEKLRKRFPHFVGCYGELLYDEYLCNKYGVENVIWVSRYAGDGFGYDFIVKDNDKYIGIEVKSTIYLEKMITAEFTMSKNEYNKYTNFIGNVDETKIVHLCISPNRIVDIEEYDISYKDAMRTRVK